MALLEIHKYPDKILKQKTGQVENLDGQLQRLIDDMVETMHYARGLGLAANQIGVSQRLCVIDLSIKDEQFPLLVLVNPVIMEKEGTVDAEEGCLSLPGHMASIKRAEKLFVKCLDREGRDIRFEAAGLLARAIQHEIDHLDGFLIFDRMSPIKREFFKRRYKKSLQEKKP
jgi:peptide deformylase